MSISQGIPIIFTNNALDSSQSLLQRYCFSVACPMWIPHPNTNYANGQANPAPSVHQCQAACLGNRECNGFDWAPAESVGQQCWLSGRWSGARGSTRGVTHYVLNRNCGGKKSHRCCGYNKNCVVLLHPRIWVDEINFRCFIRVMNDGH